MLTASQLTLERYFEPVFAPVDLAITAGELLLITGANGAGKTTLIRLLAGLATPSSGVIDRQVGPLCYLGHQLGVKDDLSVSENLSFSQALYGAGATTIQEAMARLGLVSVADQEGRTLSAGQRKRCALARLLLNPAPLWLLDEPYSNLDQQGMALVDSLLAEHLHGGGACIMSTHGALRPATLPFREYCVLAAGGQQ